MIEMEQPEGLSARKLIVETAKHNVLTAYSAEDGLGLLQRFPSIDAVLIHALVESCEQVLASVRQHSPAMPIIVASPVPDQFYPEATYVVPSHEPAALLLLLATNFGVSIRN